MWGDKDNNNNVAWINWEKTGMSKNHGGMGFKDLENFNLAMLAK
jgi:hypothetical protein